MKKISEMNSEELRNFLKIECDKNDDLKKELLSVIAVNSWASIDEEDEAKFGYIFEAVKDEKDKRAIAEELININTYNIVFDYIGNIASLYVPKRFTASDIIELSKEEVVYNLSKLTFDETALKKWKKKRFADKIKKFFMKIGGNND